MLLIFDLCLIAIATILALALRDNLELSIESVSRLLPYLVLTLAIAAPLLVIIGQNRQIWRLSGMPDYLRVTAAALATVLASTTLGFTISRLDGVARSLPILQAIIMVCLLIGARVLARNYHAWRRRGRKPNVMESNAADARENVLVIGLNRVTELYLESVAEFASDRIAIAGLLGRDDRHTGRLVQSQKVLGTPREVASVLQDLELHGVFVDRIVVTVPNAKLTPEAREALLAVVSGSDIKLDFFADHVGLAPPKREIPGEGGNSVEDEAAKSTAPVFVLDDAKLAKLARKRYWLLKRAIDFSVAAVLIVLTFPVVLTLSLLIALGIGLPIAFWQVRPGRFGQPFKIFKLRTLSNAFDAGHGRIPDELRQYAVGAFLRRTRLDELLQLYNILLGEMSFVGPRPLLPIDQPAGYAARLLVRPGLTGWAQVHGGRHVRAIDKAALDVWYVENASLWLDCRILAMTVPMVLFGERANAEAISKAWIDLQAAGIYVGPMPPVDAR